MPCDQLKTELSLHQFHLVVSEILIQNLVYFELPIKRDLNQRYGSQNNANLSGMFIQVIFFGNLVPRDAKYPTIFHTF